jgi:CheY-like chemotaxis protein
MVEAPILIVDDNEFHLRTYKSILEGKGHLVMEFETGAAAIENEEI